MNPTITKVKEKISKYNEIKIIEESDNSITVKPEANNSFPITLIVTNGKFSVYFKGWHEEFAKEEEALDCLAFGLSDDCRLQVVSYNQVEYKWILEFKEKGKWVADSEINIGLQPFWQKKSVDYYQNKIIKAEEIKNAP